jgi:hypothetical protein
MPVNGPPAWLGQALVILPTSNGVENLAAVVGRLRAGVDP